MEIKDGERFVCHEPRRREHDNAIKKAENPINGSERGTSDGIGLKLIETRIVTLPNGLKSASEIMTGSLIIPFLKNTNAGICVGTVIIFVERNNVQSVVLQNEQ